MRRALTVCALVAAVWPTSAKAQSTWAKVVEPGDELTVGDMVPTEARGFLGTGPWYAYGGSVISGGWAARVRSDGEPRWASSVDLPQLPAYNVPSLVAIDETPDGGAVALGPVQNLHGGTFYDPLGTWVVRLDGDGELLWSAEVGAVQHVGIVGHDVAATSDGGCVVVGSAHDLSEFGSPQFGYETESSRLWVARLSADGDVQWSRRIAAVDPDGGLWSSGAQSVVVTASGRIAVLGRTLTETAEGERARGTWLLLLDGTGDLLSQRASWADLGEEPSAIPLNQFLYPVQLAEVPAGGFVATSREWGYPNDKRAFLTRFDPDLTAQLMMAYPEAPPGSGRVHELRAYPVGAGRIALAGTLLSAGRRAWIAVVDGKLQPVWQRTFETEVEDRALVVVEQADTVLGPTVVVGGRHLPEFDPAPKPWELLGLRVLLTLMIPDQKFLVGGSSGLGSTGSERSLFALRLDGQGQLDGECPRFPDRDVDAVQVRVYDATPEVEVEDLALTVGPLEADVDPLDMTAIEICPLPELPDGPVGVVLPPPCVPGPPGAPFLDGAPWLPDLPWCQHEIGCLVCVPRLVRRGDPIPNPEYRARLYGAFRGLGRPGGGAIEASAGPPTDVLEALADVPAGRYFDEKRSRAASDALAAILEGRGRPQDVQALSVALAALDLDLALPAWRPAQVPAGPAAAADFAGVARVVLHDVAQAGTLDLRVEPSGFGPAGYARAWPSAILAFPFDGELEPGGWADVHLYVADLVVDAPRGALRALQWDGTTWRDVTFGRDERRGTLTARVERLDPLVLAAPLR